MRYGQLCPACGLYGKTITVRRTTITFPIWDFGGHREPYLQASSYSLCAASPVSSLLIVCTCFLLCDCTSCGYTPSYPSTSYLLSRHPKHTTPSSSPSVLTVPSFRPTSLAHPHLIAHRMLTFLATVRQHAAAGVQRRGRHPVHVRLEPQECTQ
ncbi:hypothetical protein BKA62DRAFT_51682 [Auriculariales sp. MPI-PUGE-AT-0066]|nr:hypothetical protein BKA62DRAFT_51682 [Auriculariales sp. MPI-PUGE-AT-0066]